MCHRSAAACLAIASLVFGVACVLSLFVVGALFGLIGLLLGLLHVFQKRGPNGMAWWGIGLSIFSILASVAMGVVFYRLVIPQMKNLTAVSDSAFNPWIGKAAGYLITTLDGKPISLSQLKGKRVVLDSGRPGAVHASWRCRISKGYTTKARTTI